MSEPAGSAAKLPKLNLPDVDVSDYADLDDWKIKALVALLAVGLLLWLFRKVRRAFRKRGPATLHPKLQKYGGPDTALSTQRRNEAARIIATSSTGSIAGYEVVEQLDAVYVDGFRLAEEAMEGLKAAAAMKGANALTSVRRERGRGDKYSASGDAVVVKPTGAAKQAGTATATGAMTGPDDALPRTPADKAVGETGPADAEDKPQIGGDCWPVGKEPEGADDP